MAKITWDNKTGLYPPWDERYQYTADNVNETKASINDLYDIVGAGAADDNVRVVSINTGGATNKIKDTLDAITDSSANKPYLVQVRPGAGTLQYVEDNFTIPPYVSLVSEGGSSLTEIHANTTTGIQVTMSDGSAILGFTIEDKTAGTALSVTNTGNVNIASLVIKDVNDGVVINNASVSVNINNINFKEGTQGVLNDGLRVEAGNVVAEGILGLDDVTIGGAMVRNTGANSDLTLTNVLAFSINVQTCLSFEDSSRSNVFDVSADGIYDGLVQSGGSTSTSNNIKMFNVQNDGFRGELGTGGLNEATFSGVLFEAATGGLDANITTDQFKVIGGPAQIRVEQSYFDPGAEIVVQVLNLFEGDEANKFVSELHVGSPTRPNESCLGEGDSHVQLLAYTTTDDVAFTDITDDVRSATGSTFTFPSTAAGASIYLTNLYPDSTGSPLPFYGFKSIVATAAVLGAGSFTIQYYNSNVGWIDSKYMETQSDRRYYQYAKDVFTHTGSHHIRGPLELVVETDPNLTWDVNDLPLTGTDRYWIRMRVVSAITTAPVFEQFKLHSNRFEVNGDGWVEYFGSSRPEGTLPLVLGAGRELSGNMGDNNIWIDQNLGEGLVDNRFTATTQYFGFSSTIPDDMDTSSEVKMLLACRGDGASTAVIRCLYGIVTEGGSVYTSNPGLGPIPSRGEVSASATFTGADELRFFEFSLDFSTFRARKDPADGESYPDVAFFTLNATSVPQDIEMIHLEVTYWKWCNGGHI